MTQLEPLFSICIPTCRRPGELSEALSSVLALSARPLEVLIGDDSPPGDSRSELLVEAIRCQLPADATLHYWRRSPPLGQVRNVNALLLASRGRWVCLLHDDDRLVPDGIEQLLAVLEAHPGVEAGFGLQRLLRADGQLDPSGSERLNAAYGRIAAGAGRLSNPLLAAITQQFPNDGWIARGELVRELGYRLAAADAGDFDFGLRLAQVSQSFWYLHQPCSDYRLSPEAVSTSRAGQVAALDAYCILEQLPCVGAASSARRRQLARMLQPATAAAVHNGQRITALRLLVSMAWWRNPCRWPRGLAYLLLLLLPQGTRHV